MFELLGFFFFLPVVCTAPCTHRDAYYWFTFLKRTTLRFRLHRFSLLHGGVAPLLPGAPVLRLTPALRLPTAVASLAAEQGLSAGGMCCSMHVVSSQTRDRTRVPCIGRRIFNL